MRTRNRARSFVASLILVCFASSALAPAAARAEPARRVAEPSELARESEPASPEMVEERASRLEPTLDAQGEFAGSIDPRAETERLVGGAQGPDQPITPELPADDYTRDLPSGADKSGVTSQSISTPKGSGKIDGMGESFSTQLSTGVASFSVPLALPPARGTAQPALGLAYSSGSGNGVAGMGWSVGVPFIARSTDRGLPGYDDRSTWHPNQDHFVFNGGQELVPICTVAENLSCVCATGADGVCRGGAGPGELMPPWSAGSQYFRPRVEGSFLRFFWSPDHLTWRVQDKSGVTMELGVPLDGSGDATALERNPEAPAEIYRWHLVRQYDTYGGANPAGAAILPTPYNVVVYRYLQDGGAAYLRDIFDTTPAANASTTDVALFAHHTRLAYQTRSDPSFSYRTGWRVDQRLRLARIDVSSKTLNGGPSAARRLVRRYHLSYDPSSHVSLLASVQVEGRCAGAEIDAPSEDGSGVLPATECPRLPPMRFGYERVEPFETDGSPGAAARDGYEAFDARIRQMAGDPPHSVDEGLADLFDVNADGLPDVLVTMPGKYGADHGVFFNSARGIADGFGAVEQMGIRGVLGANSNTLKLDNLNVVPLDLDGDAIADLLHMPKVKTYSTYSPRFEVGKWRWIGREITTADQQSPKIDFGNDTLDTKVLDVNFDGLVDVLVSTGKQFQTFFSLGRHPRGDGQFGSAARLSATESQISNQPVAVCVPHSGTPVRLSDGDIRLAEMNGDGIPDIVRVRRGDFQYWPGRGNGYFGTGRRDVCPADSFGTDRYLQMQQSPLYSDIQGTTLELDDVNGDGLDDLVQVRIDAIDVWINVDGAGWTERRIIDGTPAAPAFSRRVRLVDVNGSGTRDILWADGRDYKYIDLQGGAKAWLLTRIENGLGKSTDIEYTTSTAEMIAAERRGGTCDPLGKPWSSPWCKKMPAIAHVVKRVTDRDNLAVAGSSAIHVVEYDYRDPVFEGRQREFRGFERARTRRIGDDNGETDLTDSTFLLGECKDETVGTSDNGVDDCALSERWRDNPREALKGLPLSTETYDEHGVYLSGGAQTYRLRRLYVGLDGREVRYAFVSAQHTVLYDTALGPAAGSPGTLPLPAVELELVFTPFTMASDDPLVRPASATEDVTQALPLRQPAGRAEIASSSVVDFYGNRLVSSARGCVAGSACPIEQAGMKPDETIHSYTLPILPQGEQTRWLFRTGRSYVVGSRHTGVRNDTTVTYTPEGDPDDTIVWLSGTLPLERAISASLPTTGSADNEILMASRQYGPRGVLTQESGAEGRCRTIGYDSAYELVATSEAIHRDGSGTCNDPAPLATAGSYDLGFGLVTVAVDMQGQATYADYDGFGRLLEFRKPPDDGSSGRPALPSVRIEYYLPGSGGGQNHSILRTRVQDGANGSADQSRESYAYVDGFGRPRLTISEADESAGDDASWIVGAIEEYDAKGAVRRKYLPFFYDGNPMAYPLSSVPDVPYGRQLYDAFGRQLQTFDLDGTVTLQTRYHALSTDLFDAADLAAGPHQNTPASTQNDGHGRAIATTERLHLEFVVEERHTRIEYLPTGEPEVITRARGDGTERVTRWMRYDSLGRMVLNVEPNTTQNFNASPATNPTPGPSGLKTWRYAYDDAGELVGTSDARGCGQNFFYDGAGRLIAEDYAPCESHHAAYTAPNPATSAGTEVFYVYDSVPATLLPTLTRPPGFSASSPFLKGRLGAVFSRGSTTWTSYDTRGRIVRTDVRIARPNPNTADFSSRYANRWFTKDYAYDTADREIATTTGAIATNVQAAQVTGFGFPTSRDRSVVTTTYSQRGALKSIGGSYGTLVQSIDRAADGLKNALVYGDVASTTTAFSYDDRRRLRSVQTYRGPPSIWASPPANYLPAPLPNDTTSFQLLLQDEDVSYDVAGNPVEIRDWRNADEWPAGAKPRTSKVQYDDLYRIKRIDHQYPGSAQDTWQSPFSPELAGQGDSRQGVPNAHVSFDQRIHWQTFDYDWLGNTANSDDDAKGFYDRSLGAITNDSAGGKPYQLRGATNEPSGAPRSGLAGARYDVAGNLTRLDVKRNGPCLGGTDCSHRFDYRWDEVGRLVHARRWDVTAASITTPDAALPAEAGLDANLEYVYDASDQRVLKSAHAGGSSLHTAYVFDTLELRRTAFSGTDYFTVIGGGSFLTETEVVYLVAAGQRLARVVYEQSIDSEPRIGSSRQHVFLELGDHLGSTSVVLDKATSELVEYGTYQAYGATESDYRPARWAGFREDYRFTGKEEDVEVGLQYFGKRFLSPYLGRWVSADPLAVHIAREADLNLYAYVSGQALRAVDPLGLQASEGGTGAPGVTQEELKAQAERAKKPAPPPPIVAYQGEGGQSATGPHPYFDSTDHSVDAETAAIAAGLVGCAVWAPCSIAAAGALLVADSSRDDLALSEDEARARLEALASMASMRVTTRSSPSTTPKASSQRSPKPPSRTKPKPPSGPGNFGAEDVAFGLTAPRGAPGMLMNFAGKAFRGTSVPLSEQTSAMAWGAEKAAAIAKETVAYAREHLTKTGGGLRFNLTRFDTKAAMTPGSPSYDSVTSVEFRAVLADPQLRGRTTFYRNGADVTEEILRSAE